MRKKNTRKRKATLSPADVQRWLLGRAKDFNHTFNFFIIKKGGVLHKSGLNLAVLIVLDGEIVNISHDIAILCGLKKCGILCKYLNIQSDLDGSEALIRKINRHINEGVIVKENFMFTWL